MMKEYMRSKRKRESKTDSILLLLLLCANLLFLFPSTNSYFPLWRSESLQHIGGYVVLLRSTSPTKRLGNKHRTQISNLGGIWIEVQWKEP